MTGPDPSAAERLAKVVANRRFEDIDALTVDLVRRLLLDFLGVALAGSASTTGSAARAFAHSQGDGGSTLIGDPHRCGPAHAAYANAVSGHSLEFDDIDATALFHYGVAVVPAAIAAAELVRTDGRTLVRAVLAGCEMLSRLSAATNPQLRDRGFHTTSVCGAFAGSVAAGVVLGLSEQRLVHAIALGGGQASGVMEIYGASMQKRFNPGAPARGAVTGALLARAGVTGEATMIDGPRGFAQSFSGGFDAAAFDDRLGESVPLAIEFKPYACVRPVHAAIDAALLLRSRHNLRSADIAEVVVHQHPVWRGYFDAVDVRSVLEAQVSLPFSVALALACGSLEPRDFELGTASEEVRSLARRTKVAAGPDLATAVSCRVRVTTTAGDVFRATVDHPSGSAQHPLSEQELQDKFTRLAEPVVGSTAAQRLIENLGSLDRLVDVSELLRDLRPA